MTSEEKTATAAEYFTYEDNEYGTVTITGYIGSDTEVVIPEQIDGKSVTGIGGDAFYCCDSLTSIEIPASVTEIGSEVFYGCSSLTNIIVDEDNTRYTSAGSNCIIEKSSNTLIAGCSRTIIPDSVMNIGIAAFSGFSSLTNIEIPDSVVSIEATAFMGCSGLTSIEISDSVTNIGDRAFAACGLASIVVGEGNNVYTDAGSNCIIEKSSNTLIIGCSTTIIPNSVTSIGSYAFEYCSKLTSIEIPASVTSIESSAFEGCSGLTSIEIPASVTSIESSAFEGCSSLTSIVVSDGNPVYTSAESNCIIEKSSNTLMVGCSKTIIPASVTSIGSGAFSGCSGLTSIEIPSGVTSIGDGTFYGCESLTSIEIPTGVMNIGEIAFYWCRSLTSIEIPDSVTSIGRWAFEDCSGLTSIKIPASVTSIGEYAFRDCYELTIYCSADSYARQYAIDNNIPYKSLEEWVEPSCAHANTELRNAASATCTKAGYTGDTYCKDCGELVSKGKSIAALGHSCKATVTKQPTMDAEGVRTYTCSRCKASYTEKIAKLTVTYTVKFNGNGADSGSVANQKMTYGSKTALNANKFKKKGYTFKGWNTKKDGTGTAYANKADGSKLTKTNGATVTLYAQWTANKYTITFNGNGSTSGSMKKLSNCKYGKKYTQTKNGFKKKGYTFTGWNAKKDGSGKTYKNKAEVKNLSSKADGKVTLYAQWKKTKYTISYNLNKGKNNKNNPTSYNITTKTIKLKNPTRKGYTFAGWYSDKKCTKKVTQIKKGSTGNITLYAKWKKK